MNKGAYGIPDLQLPDFTAERTLTLGSTEAIKYVLLAYGFSILTMGLGWLLPSVFTVPFVVISLTFVPGTLLLLSISDEDLRVNAEHVLYAFGSSLVILMFVGALINILLPLVGVPKPLMPVPLAVSVTATVGCLAILARWQNPVGTVTVHVPPLWSPVPLALFLFPLLSVLGVSLINATGLNLLLIVVLLAIGLLPVVAVTRLPDRWHSLAVWTMSLAILYHKSLWQHAGFGGRPHGITAWEAGRWSPGIVSIDPYSSELLQNGVLFPLYARLSNIFIMTQYEVVNPFLVSFLPVALYVAFRRYVPTNIAFLGAALFAFSHPFYLQYPTAGRAATPVIFFGLFGVALSNEGVPSGSRAVLAATFLVGIVVTHYGTSYYIAAALGIALVLLYLLWSLDSVVRSRFQHSAPVQDGGRIPVDRIASRRSTIFSLTTVSFFISSALGWYLYTRQGWKFSLLPNHIYDNVMTLIEGSVAGGRTTARVQESYSSTSIEVSKNIYVMLAVLTLVGLAVVYYRRVVARNSSFDDHYLTIATALFGIFGTTIILHNWGGGRPMMITFSFTTVFAVLGAVWVMKTVKRGGIVASEFLPESWDVAARIRQHVPTGTGVYVVAGILLVFFTLNSGLAASTVFDEFAPSNVPGQATLATSNSAQSQVTVHRQFDIATHVWLVRHLDDRYSSYGDTFGARQYDWYRPDVAARTPVVGGGYSRENRPEVFDVERQGVGEQPGYVLVMGHNWELDRVWPAKTGPAVPLEELSLDRRERIYTNGESHIYFYSDQNQSVR